MTEPTPITVAYGDGIGPEIMEATLDILREAKADIKVEVIQVGAKMYERGHSSGLDNAAWESIHRTKVLLKAPITTPQGGGYKSLNVTLRKTLGLYANVRPCKALSPYVKTHFPNMDLVIVRENEEDLYAGVEHRQTADVCQSLKLITRQGSEKIMRFAFDYAVKNNRKKVTCMSKDNIMKLTDGLFHKVYDEVAAEYNDIEKEHFIIDIGAARIASRPDYFDVVVTENLYGDIISDIAADVCGSVGQAGSANIGQKYAMFEAIHGSAPDIAGQNIANPSGLLNGAIMMLVHIGQPEVAAKIHNAWLRTLEDGVHTADIYNDDISKEKAGTKEFAQAVIARLGQLPQHFDVIEYKDCGDMCTAQVGAVLEAKVQKKELVGVDVFLDFTGDVAELGPRIEAASSNKVKFHLMTSRGLKVYPDTPQGLTYSDHWRCRFYGANDSVIQYNDVIEVLKYATDAGLEVIKTENLYKFDGERGFSLAQGE